MEIFTNTIQRPLSPAGACAPLAVAVPVAASVSVVAVSATAGSAGWRSGRESFAPVAEQAHASQAHQVRVAAEQALTLAAARGGYDSPVFGSSNGIDAVKPRMTVGANGVPPRGRPV
ncbi:MAG TPA: hypothetical protein VFO77_03035 [Actinoplanes sp.]|nr:hypothetical protein [Actinoplanes sp.]